MGDLATGRHVVYADATDTATPDRRLDISRASHNPREISRIKQKKPPVLPAGFAYLLAGHAAAAIKMIAVTICA